MTELVIDRDEQNQPRLRINGEVIAVQFDPARIAVMPYMTGAVEVTLSLQVDSLCFFPEPAPDPAEPSTEEPA